MQKIVKNGWVGSAKYYTINSCEPMAINLLQILVVM